MRAVIIPQRTIESSPLVTLSSTSSLDKQPRTPPPPPPSAATPRRLPHPTCQRQHEREGPVRVVAMQPGDGVQGRGGPGGQLSWLSCGCFAGGWGFPAHPCPGQAAACLRNTHTTCYSSSRCTKWLAEYHASHRPGTAPAPPRACTAAPVRARKAARALGPLGTSTSCCMRSWPGVSCCPPGAPAPRPPAAAAARPPAPSLLHAAVHVV